MTVYRVLSAKYKHAVTCTSIYRLACADRIGLLAGPPKQSGPSRSQGLARRRQQLEVPYHLQKPPASTTTGSIGKPATEKQLMVFRHRTLPAHLQANMKYRAALSLNPAQMPTVRWWRFCAACRVSSDTLAYFRHASVRMRAVGHRQTTAVLLVKKNVQ